MALANFPDWKRIGKKVRDLFPPEDRGPSPEERRQQRLRDVFKGFAYFDTFEEVRAWSVADVDALQRSNTPLLIRSAAQVHDQSGPKTSILLCHDYSGGYHDYESVRPAKHVEEKLYSCGYFQHIETFIYFSHKLVCVPPPTWINSMHRNGVKILGTFMLEPGKEHVEQLFYRDGDEYVVAKHLAKMSQIFGFDGWLLNVEIELPSLIPHVTDQLLHFVESLRRLLGNQGKVIWYDALTTENRVKYANGLSIKNSQLALAAGGLFTNYKWTESNLKDTKLIAQWNNIDMADVYFGIDVWAQNTNMPGPPRKTYPPDGGGGTLTGMATSLLAEYGYSTAIFGPAWTHEHFPVGSLHGQPMAQAVQRSMWEGTNLPQELGCDCRKGRPHHADAYKSNPITKSARKFPSGSSTFLETDFSCAFRPFVDVDAQNKFCSKLGSMAVMPPNLSKKSDMLEQNATEHSIPVMINTIETWPENHLEISLSWSDRVNFRPKKNTNSPELKIVRLCLFNVNMAVDTGLIATMKCTHVCTLSDIRAGFYLAYQIDGQMNLYYEHMEVAGEKQFENGTISLPVGFANARARLVQIGSYCKVSCDMEWSDSLVPLFRIYRLIVRPKNMMRTSWSIGDIKTLQRTLEGNVEKRISWTWKGYGADWPDELPWSSEGSGPFSHFLITMDGREIGDAYCQEFPLRRDDFDEMDGAEEVKIIIRGLFFGGGSVVSPETIVSKADLLVSDSYCSFG